MKLVLANFEKAGAYPGGAVNDRVSRRLKEMAEKLAKYQGEEKGAAS